MFRWDELDLVCRAAALRDPGLPHPGPLVALLARFAIAADDVDVASFTPILDAAYSHLRTAAGPEAEAYWPSSTEWPGERDLRGASVTWQTDADGDTFPEQPAAHAGTADLHTLRRPPGVKAETEAKAGSDAEIDTDSDAVDEGFPFAA
ncbi:hypothetical protein [Streptodolium elevatio]|uniref:Uncharacterized protein n=1 Tax=Streptodolium elevatio TaxID=3157996 RepID=A0ABV3DKP8_9ACTN